MRQVLVGAIVLDGEVTAPDEECAVGDVLSDGCAACNKAIVAHGEGRDKVAVAPDETIVAHHRAVLCFAVVVDKNHAATDVGVAADGSVADVGKVAGFYAVAEGAVFDLDKVAHAAIVADCCAVTQMRIGTDHAVVADGAVANARGLDHGVATDLTVGYVAETADCATVVYHCVTLDDGIRLDCYVVADHDGGLDVVHILLLEMSFL